MKTSDACNLLDCKFCGSRFSWSVEGATLFRRHLDEDHADRIAALRFVALTSTRAQQIHLQRRAVQSGAAKSNVCTPAQLTLSLPER